MTTRSFRIFGPKGVHERGIAFEPEPNTPRVHARTVADRVPVCDIMSCEVVCATPELEIAGVVELVLREKIGCVPIVDDRGQPIGMITKLDLVEHLVARDPASRVTAGEIMMPLAITLDHNATVAHAASLMASEDMHHVMIVRDRQLLGVVSTMDIARWLADNDELLS